MEFLHDMRWESIESLHSAVQTCELWWPSWPVHHGHCGRLWWGSPWALRSGGAALGWSSRCSHCTGRGEDRRGLSGVRGGGSTSSGASSVWSWTEVCWHWSPRPCSSTWLTTGNVNNSICVQTVQQYSVKFIWCWNSSKQIFYLIITT